MHETVGKPEECMSAKLMYTDSKYSESLGRGKIHLGWNLIEKSLGKATSS